MTDSDLIAKYLKDNEVTKCPPVQGQGAGLSALSRRDLTKARKEYRDEHGTLNPVQGGPKDGH